MTRSFLKYDGTIYGHILVKKNNAGEDYEYFQVLLCVTHNTVMRDSRENSLEISSEEKNPNERLNESFKEGGNGGRQKFTSFIVLNN